MELTRRILLKGALTTPLVGQIAATSTSGQDRERVRLDAGWRFHFGHANDPSMDFGFGANGETFAKSGNFADPCRSNFDDRDWTPVDVPHDWAVELPFYESRELAQRGSKPLGRAHPETSIGWYRRVFTIPNADRGKRIVLEFDGVFRAARVALNGFYLATNESGYAPFRFDITDFVNYDSPNTVVLRVDATLGEGWFYEGAGIYRHVWLVKTNSLHVAHDGVYVRATTPIVEVSTDVVNDSGRRQTCRVRSSILEAGRVWAVTASEVRTLDPWSMARFDQKIELRKPRLWSVEEPNLYQLRTGVETHGAVTDQYMTTFGVRTIRWDAMRGLILNDRPVKIKGACQHQDHAGVGTALPDRVHAFRVERLKAMGANAIRTAHNPPSREFLDVCDRLGMLVVNETRMMSSSPEGLSQIERMILRDRNHPSVILWSLGNEEIEQGTDRGARMVGTLKQRARELDPSRAVTVAMSAAWERDVSAIVDVEGFNYAEAPDLDAFRSKFPAKPAIGMETASSYATRGVYANDSSRGFASAYDVNFPAYGSSAEAWWNNYDQRPWLAGGFIWAGFDYRGEPGPFGWPCISSQFGVLDTCGFPKDSFFYYKSWWGSDPVLHLFPHWNWTDGQMIDVWCYTNLDRVELWLNGRSVGTGDVAKNSHLQWKLPFTPGVIEARGFRAGRQVLTARRETADAAARIVLRPDRSRIAADGDDVAMLAVEVQDTSGRIVPDADHEIALAVSGCGRLIGVGNGSPSSHESDKGARRRVFNGMCMAIVRSSGQAGELTIEASSYGLVPASALIVCES